MENSHFKAHYTGRLSDRTCLHMQKIKHIFKYISCRSITSPEIGSPLHVLRNACSHVTIHTGCFRQFCRYTVTTLPLSPLTYTSCRGQFTCCQLLIPRCEVMPTRAIIECLLQEVQTTALSSHINRSSFPILQVFLNDLKWLLNPKRHMPYNSGHSNWSLGRLPIQYMQHTNAVWRNEEQNLKKKNQCTENNHFYRSSVTTPSLTTKPNLKVSILWTSRLWHRRFGRTYSLLLQDTGCTHRPRKLK
jgi:hypothetical protein